MPGDEARVLMPMLTNKRPSAGAEIEQSCVVDADRAELHEDLEVLVAIVIASMRRDRNEQGRASREVVKEEGNSVGESNSHMSDPKIRRCRGASTHDNHRVVYRRTRRGCCQVEVDEGDGCCSRRCRKALVQPKASYTPRLQLP